MHLQLMYLNHISVCILFYYIFAFIFIVLNLTGKNGTISQMSVI